MGVTSNRPSASMKAKIGLENLHIYVPFSLDTLLAQNWEMKGTIFQLSYKKFLINHFYVNYLTPTLSEEICELFLIWVSLKRTLNFNLQQVSKWHKRHPRSLALIFSSPNFHKIRKSSFMFFSKILRIKDVCNNL